MNPVVVVPEFVIHLKGCWVRQLRIQPAPIVTVWELSHAVNAADLLVSVVLFKQGKHLLHLARGFGIEINSTVSFYVVRV